MSKNRKFKRSPQFVFFIKRNKTVLLLALSAALAVFGSGCAAHVDKSASKAENTPLWSATVSAAGNSAPSSQTEPESPASAQTSSKSSVIYSPVPDFLTPATGFVYLQKTVDYKYATNYLLKTTNGGKSWTTVKRGLEVTSIAFADAKTGYGLLPDDKTDGSAQNILVKTVDGGVTWKTVEALHNEDASSLDVLNENVVFTVPFSDSKDYIYRTEDGGKSWSQLNPPEVNKYVFSLNGLSFLSANEGYAYCGSDAALGSQGKAVYYTDDSGNRWTLKSQVLLTLDDGGGNVGTLSTAGHCDGIRFFAGGTGYIGAGPGGVMKSTDGGVHFTDAVRPDAFEYQFNTGMPDFVNDRDGYKFFLHDGTESMLEHTADGGNSWRKVITASGIAAFLSSTPAA